MRKERLVDGFLIDPDLPGDFWQASEKDRPESHMPFLGKPFILTVPHSEWADGVRYDVYQVSERVWGRPICMWKFGTLNEALRCAKHQLGDPDWTFFT